MTPDPEINWQAQSDPLEKNRGRKTKSEIAETRLSRSLDEQKSSENPEEKKKKNTTQTQLDKAIGEKDVIGINDIIRNPEKRKNISSEELRRALATLREIHMGLFDKTPDKALMAIRGDVKEEITQVSRGYNELAKILQGNLDSLEPLSPKAGKIIQFQDEVAAAEKSLKELEKSLDKTESSGPQQNPAKETNTSLTA